MKSAILDQIWSGTIVLKDSSEMSEIAQILTNLLSVPVVCFVSDTVDARQAPAAWVAAEEVFPGASLADILWEELDIEVSEDTIVYLEPTAIQQTADASGNAMTDAVYQVLATLANARGNFAMLERQMRAAAQRGEHSFLGPRLTSVSLVQ